MRPLPGRLTRLVVLISTLTIGVAVLAACGSSEPSGEPGPGEQTTVEHKFGMTTVPAAPQRVVSVGYYDHDALLALGVVPVATREFTGHQPSATWPWARDRLGSAQPEVLPLNEIDPERLAALRPDLIVGVSAGLTKEQYDSYSAIAPTVPAPHGFVDYGVPWPDTIRLIGTAVGKRAEADALITDLRAKIAETRGRFPQLAGKKIAGIRPSTEAAGGFFVFGPQDLRSRFFADIGMRGVPAFDQAAGDKNYGKFSTEQIGMLDEADVVVLFAEAEQERARFRSTPGYANLRVVRENRVVTLTAEQGAALSFNSVLSIPVALDSVPQELVKAAG